MGWLIGAIFSFWSVLSLVVVYVLLKDAEILVWAAGVLFIGILCTKKYRDYKSGKAEQVYEEKEKLRQMRLKERKEVIRDKETEKQEKKEQREEKKKKVFGMHQAGLPLAYGANCSIKREDHQFVFEGGGNCFTLSKDRITDISVRTDRETNSQYVSSIGGAIGGAAALGSIGAMVGGRAKEIKSTKAREYLIFTYRKDEQISYISIELLAPSKKVWEWQREICKSNKENERAMEL